MKNLTILVSACGSPSMPGIIECFRSNSERKIKIIGMDMSDEPSVKYLVDRFYKVPPVTDDNYCEIVLEICQKEHVDIYFPLISAEVSAVSKKIDDFKKINVIVSISDLAAVSISNDKLRTYKLLSSKKIPTPNFFEVNSLDDFVEGCKVLGYPNKAVCLKIVDGSGSRGVRIIDSSKSRYDIFINEKPNSFFTSYDDMLNILRESTELHKMLLVEYMPGTEYTVDALASNGKVLFMVGRENVVSLMSIAQESIVTYDEEAYKIAESVIELLKYDGNIGFDFMRDESGRPMLMDINPRITATVSVIAAAGVNLPYLRIKQLLNEPLPKELKINYGTRIKRRYGEIYTNKDGKRIDISGKVVDCK